MSELVKIVPAVLTDDSKSLTNMIEQAKLFTDFVQIDLMDGTFVPSRSITPEELVNIKPDISWEAHIMANEPEKILHFLKDAGASRIIFHYEATDNHEHVIKTARSLELGVGIALSPSTPGDVLKDLASLIDYVLFMTVNPGYYGAKFIPEVLSKIKAFRQQYKNIEIGIDGGVKEDNLKLIVNSEVNSVCVGSAIFLSESPAQSYRKFLDIANS